MSIKYLQEYDQSFKTNENFASMLQANNPFKERIEGSVVDGIIIAINNDYISVDIRMKFEGQIPIKELMLGKEAKDFKDLDIKIGDVIKVYVEKAESDEDEGGNSAVLSYEKAIRHQRWPELEKAAKDNEVVHGIIFAKVKGGFAVDLQGVIAFLPLRQIDIKIVRDASPLMGIMQPFQILKMDKKQDNIVVSRRAILEASRTQARAQLLSNIEEGQIVEGTIKNITGYGAFVDLGGIDGLLHVTDISWGRISHPSEVLSLGQKVKAKITKLSLKDQRISLGMKQLQENPWKETIEKYKIGEIYNCTVKSIADYGAFVELEPGIEGLVYVTEISWSKADNNPHSLLHKGQQANVMVLSIDHDKNRISLSIKRCTDNPWENFAKQHKIGDVIEHEINRISDSGVFVALGEGIEGFVSPGNIAWEGKPSENMKGLKVKQKVKAKIIKIDLRKEQINLGIKQVTYDPLEALLNKLSEGEVLSCKVINLSSEGLEVNITKDVNILIKAFKLFDSAAGKFKLGDFKKGSTIQATVTELAPKRRVVELSIKSLSTNE